LEVLETMRPYQENDLGNRIRVIWAGAEYRGRGRETIWDGSATITDNTVRSVTPINMYNLEKTICQSSPQTLEWAALTTGGFGGFDCMLEHPHAGILQIDTALVQCRVPLEEIGMHERRFDAGGLDRHVRISRLPQVNPHTHVCLERTIALRPAGDNPLYVCVTQEDGHQAWSSPIYLFRA
jgi:hypothetical protein